MNHLQLTHVVRIIYLVLTGGFNISNQSAQKTSISMYIDDTRGEKKESIVLGVLVVIVVIVIIIVISITV